MQIYRREKEKKKYTRKKKRKKNCTQSVGFAREGCTRAKMATPVVCYVWTSRRPSAQLRTEQTIVCSSWTIADDSIIRSTDRETSGAEPKDRLAFAHNKFGFRAIKAHNARGASSREGVLFLPGASRPLLQGRASLSSEPQRENKRLLGRRAETSVTCMILVRPMRITTTTTKQKGNA